MHSHCTVERLAPRSLCMHSENLSRLGYIPLLFLAGGRVGEGGGDRVIRHDSWDLSCHWHWELCSCLDGPACMVGWKGIPISPLHAYCNKHVYTLKFMYMCKHTKLFFNFLHTCALYSHPFLLSTVDSNPLTNHLMSCSTGCSCICTCTCRKHQY